MLDRIANVVPYVAFLVALFFVELQLFGVEDALLGVIFQSFARTMVESAGLSFVNYLKHAALFLVMSLCSSLAGLHPVLLVAGSAVYMFCITLMNSDDYLPRNFFMLGLGFLLLEIYPISAHEIPMRMVATLFAVACTTAFIYAMRYFSAQSEITQDRGFVMRAFDDIGFQLIDLSNLDVSKLDAHRVYDITREYCNKEYGNVFRQGGVLSGRQRYTFSLLICAEQIADMMHGASRNVHSMEQAERDYLLDLSEVFLGFGQGRIKQVRAMISALQEFLDTHRLENLEHDTAWRATLEAMMCTLSDSKASRDNSTPFGLGVRYRLHFIKDNFSLKNSQLRFSIQLGVIVGVSFAVSELMLLYMDTRFGAWIPITSFLMMNTYRDETDGKTAFGHAGWHGGVRGRHPFHPRICSDTLRSHYGLWRYLDELWPCSFYGRWYADGACRPVSHHVARGYTDDAFGVCSFGNSRGAVDYFRFLAIAQIHDDFPQDE